MTGLGGGGALQTVCFYVDLAWFDFLSQRPESKARPS